MFERWIGWPGLISAVLGVAVAAGLWISLGRMLEKSRQGSSFLAVEIAKLDKELGEVGRLNDVVVAVLARGQVLATLRQQRYAVRLFEELARHRPDGVVLASLRDDPRSLVIRGFAASEREADMFLTNVRGSPLFEGAQRVESHGAESAPRPAGYPTQFTLEMTLKGRP